MPGGRSLGNVQHVGTGLVTGAPRRRMIHRDSERVIAKRGPPPILPHLDRQRRRVVGAYGALPMPVGYYLEDPRTSASSRGRHGDD